MRDKMLAMINYIINKIRIKLFFILIVCSFFNLKVNGQEKKHIDTNKKIENISNYIMFDIKFINYSFNISHIERIRPYLNNKQRSRIKEIISKRKSINKIISLYKNNFNAKEIDSIYKFFHNDIEIQTTISKRLEKKMNFIYDKANNIENNLKKYLYNIDSTNYKFDSIFIESKKNINGFYELTSNINTLYKRVKLSDLSKKPIINFNKIEKIEFGIDNFLCYFCYPIKIFLYEKSRTELNQIIKKKKGIKLVLIINGDVVLAPLMLKSIIENNFFYIAGNYMSYKESKKIVDTFNNYR